QGRRRLPEADIAKPDVVEGPQPAVDLRNVAEELARLGDRHLEDIGDRAALEPDLQGLAVVAAPVALLAGHVDVGQEVHLDLDLAVASADLAAAALDVEAEPARLVPARPRLPGLGEERPDVVEHARVRRGIGPWSPADRR